MLSVKYTSRLERRGRGAFLFLALIPVLLGATVLWSVARFRAESEQVEHSLRTITVIAHFQTAITQAESDVRGYLVTADPAFLRQFEDRRAQFGVEAVRLRNISLEDPHQLTRIQNLISTATARINFLQMVAQLRESGQPPLSI